jgi:hypothetical protein
VRANDRGELAAALRALDWPTKELTKLNDAITAALRRI